MAGTSHAWKTDPTRALRVVMWVALLLLPIACGGSGKYDAASPLASVRRAAMESEDGGLVARWLLAELLSPGGDPQAAKNARKRLDGLDGEHLLAHLARGLDDVEHGRLHTAPAHYLSAVRAARGSNDPNAALYAWFAAHNAVALRHNAPGLWQQFGPMIEEAMREPQGIGWRARGELVEWWAEEAYGRAKQDLDEASAREFGCLTSVRLAGPFGRGAAADITARFESEQPGPWPARWKKNPAMHVAPRVLKTRRTGCFVGIDEPVPGGVFYAESFLELDGPTELVLAVQGSVAVRVNDELVLNRDPRIWAVWPRFGVQLWLAAGRHRILARITEPNTSVRVMAPDGRPLGAKSSIDAAPGYSLVPPRRTADPNVLSRFIGNGGVIDPKDDLLRFIAASLAAVEGQGDLASVLAEPLLKEPSRATAAVLSASARFAEKDPLFDRGELKDLVRELQERAVKRDPESWCAQLSLALWQAERAGPTEAVRALKQLAERFPHVPAVLLALSRVYGELGWTAEYAANAKEIARRFPEDVEALSLAAAVYDAEGDFAKADAMVQRLTELDRDSEVALSRALARADYAAALSELRRLAERRPERKELTERIHDVMVRAGNASETWKKLQAAVEKSPRSGGARLALADARFAQGDKDALRLTLVDAVSQGAGTEELENALDLVEGVSQLEPYRLKARPIIKEFEASGRNLPGTAARVLDYAAIWVHADGSSRMLEHEVIRIQSPEAIDKLAEHPKLSGLVLHMRVLKKDGRSLEPEIVPGKPTVTFPHLEVGDYIETEHIVTKPSESAGGRQYVGPHWFFREENVPYARSELVVITPADKQLVIETRGAVPQPELKDLGGLMLRRWRVDDSPAAPQEPGSAPITEFLPSVRVGWGVTLDERMARLADSLTDLTPVDPRIARIARRIVEPLGPKAKEERARRLYRWVLANVEEGPETDGRRVIIGKQGNRWRGFVSLCRALGLEVGYAVGRNRLSAEPSGPLERASQFSEPLLRLKTESGERWLTLVSKFAPFGYVPAELRGVTAYLLTDRTPKKLTTPTTGTEDSVVYEGTIVLGADGSAKLDLVQRFHGKYAMAVRSAVTQLSEAQLRDLVESRLLGRALRGARLRSFELEALDDLDQPLALKMRAEMSGFAHNAGPELMIAPPFAPEVSQLAALPARQTPLLIGETTHQEVRLRVELPPGAKVHGARKTTVQEQGFVVRVADRVEDGVLLLDRVVDIPAGRVLPAAYPRFVDFARRADEALSGTLRVRPGG